jgi:riboflavin synthase alpha subunit
VFTGIIRETGRVVSAHHGGDGLALVVHAPETTDGLAAGGSVAVNGVCLTAERVENGRVAFHAVPETVARSTLASLAGGDLVNLEPALRAGEPLGGHYVQGHVDGRGRVRSMELEGDGARIVIEAPAELLRYCVEKGSIAVDGVSLTIAELQADVFAAVLVPHTLQATTLSRLAAADEVNLEVDVLAKYIERLLQSREEPGLRSGE